jgi:hypothetical protein
MTRKLWWPVMAIAVAMIALPFAISLPSRASHGQSMIDNFHSIMQPAAVAKTVNYENGTFAQLRPVAVNAVKAAGEVPKLGPALATAMHTDQAHVSALLSKGFPALAATMSSLPKMAPVFSRVPAGLDWYAPIVKTMQTNVNNYSSISGLPNFRLFTWFFVVPGALLLLISGYGLGLHRLVRMPTMAGGRHHPLTH